MEYRSLGQTGLRVSAIGLGGNVFGPPRQDLAASLRNIHRAQELGINFIDTAHLYNGGQSEEFIGKAIADRRSAFYVATKFHFLQMGDDETPAQRIRKQCETSLQRLGTDYLDLYQVHFPAPDIPDEAILSTLDGLVEEGKVHHIGECNYAAWRHMQALETSRRLQLPPMLTAQNQFNLLRRHAEAELIPFCDANNIGFLPYFPLAGGFLSGKYRPGEPAPPGSRGATSSPIIARTRNTRNERILAELQDFAAQRDRSVLELAIAWLLAHPAISSVIAGAMNLSQLDENAAAVTWNLTREEKKRIDEITASDVTTELAEPTPAVLMGR
jgi:aryl-alcohol dehydrogenase-like predicted oxidoreductase